MVIVELISSLVLFSVLWVDLGNGQECSEQIARTKGAVFQWNITLTCKGSRLSSGLCKWTNVEYYAYPLKLRDEISFYAPYKTRFCKTEMQLKYETNGLLKEIPLEFEHYRTRVLPGPFDGWEEGEVEETEWDFDYGNYYSGGNSHVLNLELSEENEMKAVKFYFKSTFDGNSKSFKVKDNRLKSYFLKFKPSREGSFIWEYEIVNWRVFKKNIPMVFSPEVRIVDESKREWHGLQLGRFVQFRCDAYSFFASEENANTQLVWALEGVRIPKYSKNRKIITEVDLEDYIMSQTLVINAVQFSDIGRYTCTFTESREKVKSTYKTLNYEGSDPGAFLPQMFLESDQIFFSAKRIWSATGNSDPANLVLSADKLCAITGGRASSYTEIEKLIASFESDIESSNASRLLETVLLEVEGKKAMYVNSSDSIGCLTSDDWSFASRDCTEAGGGGPSAMLCTYEYGRFYSLVEPRECLYEDLDRGIDKRFTVQIVGSKQWDLKCIGKDTSSNAITHTSYYTLRSGEAIQLSLPSIDQIPFGSRIKCGAGSHDNEDDPDDDHPIASLEIPARQPIDLAHIVEQVSVISEIRLDTDDEVRGVGNYYSSGFLICKAEGFPFPQMQWKKVVTVNGTEMLVNMGGEDKEDIYVKTSDQHDPNYGKSECATFHRINTIYFIKILPEHSGTYFCTASDPLTGEEKVTQRVTLFGIESVFSSRIEYSIKSQTYIGKVVVTGPPIPDFVLRCQSAIAWRAQDAIIIDRENFLYEMEFLVYGAQLGGNCTLGIFNGFGDAHSDTAQYTESLSQVGAEFNRATLTLKCSLYAFPIVIENLIPSCSEMELSQIEELPDLVDLSGVFGAIYRRSSGIPNSFTSCSCVYTAMNGTVLESTIEILPSSFDRSVVRLRPVLKVLEDSINSMPQIYDYISAEMMAVALDKVRLSAFFAQLTTAEILEVAKTLTYASRTPTVYYHENGYSTIKMRIAKVRSSGFLLAHQMTRNEVSSRLTFEEKQHLHQAISDFSSHIARQYKAGEKFNEKLGPIAIHGLNLDLNNLEDILVSEETQNGLTRGIINAVMIQNTTLRSVIPLDAQTSTLVVLFTDAFYVPKSPEKTKPDTQEAVRKNQYVQYQEAQSINSGLLQVFLEVDQFYKSTPVEFKLNQRDSEKDTKRDESEDELYEMRVQSMCVYFETASDEDSVGFWSEEGCVVVAEKSNPSQTYCKCSHTTMFAINSLVNENKADSFVPSEYRVISYIGSNVALVINIFNFMLQLNVDRVMTNEQNKVHYLLVQTVIFFQLVYLVGVERKNNPILCKATAFVLQNCMLMAFCWNFCVGLYLLNRVKKFIVGKVLLRFMIFNVISWGYPAMVSVIFYMLFRDLYGVGSGCFIAMGNYWPIFYAPRVPIFIGNITCLFTTVLAVKKLKKMKRSLKKQILYTVKGELVVIPTIQMTFLFCAQGMQSQDLVFQIGNGLTLVGLSVVLLFYTTLFNPEFWEARAKIRERDAQIKKFNTLSKFERKVEEKMKKLKKLKNSSKNKKNKTYESEPETIDGNNCAEKYGIDDRINNDENHLMDDGKNKTGKNGIEMARKGSEFTVTEEYNHGYEEDERIIESRASADAMQKNILGVIEEKPRDTSADADSDASDSDSESDTDSVIMDSIVNTTENKPANDAMLNF